MTTFKQGGRPRAVWDAGANRITVRFVNGQFSTEDPALINKLIEAGYRQITEDNSVTQPPLSLKRKKKGNSNE